MRRRPFPLLPVLAAAAALKVLFFAAVFPPFNNVDEAFHYDNVLKYAAGRPPRDLERFSPRGAEAAARLSSPDYFVPPVIPARPDPAEAWAARVNHVAVQPPLYYAAAAAWSKVSTSVWWLRALNAFFAAGLVWCVWTFAGAAFPGRPFVPKAAALLAAVWPQDAFYGVSNDPLAGLLFAAALVRPHGLLAAGAFLTKLSNMGVVFLLGRRPRQLLIAGVPIALWLLSNHLAYGDLTGAGRYADLLGWRRKTFLELFEHPVWDLDGMLFFLGETARTFWRGEFVWHGRRLAWAPADRLYVLSSLAIFLAGARSPEQRRGWAALGLLVGFLLGSSLIYRFTDGWYPSAASPFLVSGRLILGAAPAFFAFYAAGWERLLGRRAAWAVGAVASVAVLSELILTWKAPGFGAILVSWR